MKIALSAFILLWSFAGWTADGGAMDVEKKQTEPAKPSVVKSGDDYFIDFKDGRIAGFFQEVGKTSRSYLKLRQIENTCDFEQVLAQCRLHMDFASRDLSVRWIKHPEAAKIGEVLTVIADPTQGAQDEKIQQKGDIFTWYSSRTEKVYQTRMRRDRLVCDRMDWAKDLQQVNGKYIIHSWAAEVMTVTAETGVNENQTQSAAFDVLLNKLDNTSFELVSFGRTGNQFSSGLPFLSNQVATLNFLDKNNKSCMVSFEASAEEAIKLIRQESFLTTDPSTRQTIKNTASIQSSVLFSYLAGLQRGFKVK